MNPGNDQACLDLGLLYRKLNKDELAEVYLKKTLSINPLNARAARALETLYREQGLDDLSQEYESKVDKYNLNPLTSNNYRKIKEILEQMGITLVCVQYPVRSVLPLEHLFEGEENVIFVDNEKVFKEALQHGNWREYFTDMFTGDFGHCTARGNKLLAGNIANRILGGILKSIS